MHHSIDDMSSTHQNQIDPNIHRQISCRPCIHKEKETAPATPEKLDMWFSQLVPLILFNLDCCKPHVSKFKTNTCWTEKNENGSRFLQGQRDSSNLWDGWTAELLSADRSSYRRLTTSMTCLRWFLDHNYWSGQGIEGQSIVLLPGCLNMFKHIFPYW